MAVGFLALWLLFLVFGSPLLRDRMGIGHEEPTFPAPATPETVAIPAATAGGAPYTGEARWDAEGVCLVLQFEGAPRTRSCAIADPLQPIWGIDLPQAPDGAHPLVVATAPDVVEVVASLERDDGDVRATPAGRELPAAFAVLDLPRGGVVDRITAYDGDGRELAVALCGRADGGVTGPLGGGCSIDRDV